MAVPELSLTEERIVRLLAEGLSKGEIAEAVGLDERTVDWHLERAGRKLGPPQAGQGEAVVTPHITMKERSARMLRFRAPTRVLVAAVSLLLVAASVLAVTASAQSGSRSSHRNRPFHLTKNCRDYGGGVGSYCTVTSANVPAITVGTKIFYAQAAGATSLDSDIILYAGAGNTATGHCALDFTTGLGQCTLSGGTGTLDGIRARVDVSHLGGFDWAWDGTYRLHEDD